MKKIISLFKRDYGGDRLVYDEVTPGAEWVLAGEGVATVKYDGTCCMVRAGRLYKRFDWKVTKAAKRRGPPFTAADAKPAPDDWEACEARPNEHTGHWPGWLPVGDGPEDRWHREAWEQGEPLVADSYAFNDGTYELLGPKIQGNPYGLLAHWLIPHGTSPLPDAPRTFVELRDYLHEPLPFEGHVEGIVWHHPDGRMVKIRRRDFGFEWPVVSRGEER